MLIDEKGYLQSETSLLYSCFCTNGGIAQLGERLRPGMRVLVVVGASHKAYLEAYLNQMHDVRIVGTDAILRQED